MTRPDGHAALLALTRREDGTYQGRFRDTAQLGIYQVGVHVTASSPEGIRLTRERYFSGFIHKPKPRKGSLPPRKRYAPSKRWKKVNIADFLKRHGQ